MLVLGLLLAALAVFPARWLWAQQVANLPPGPKPHIFSGNASHVPPSGFIKKLRQWHHQYGSLLRLKFGHGNTLFIADRTTAKDLLDRRGKIYSSRPRLVMGLEIMSGGDHTFFLPYGPKWRRHNKIQTSVLNPRAIKHYRPVQDLESLQTLQHLGSTTDKDYQQVFSRFQASLIHSLAYGSRIVDFDDPQLQEVQEIANASIQAITTQQWAVDSYPILKYVPGWIAPWKRYATRMHAQIVQVFGSRTQAATKTGSWNWVKHIRSLKQAEGVSEHELLFLSGSIYQAGVEIIASSLRLALMACALHPDPVARAQDELDRVVGTDRLPTFDDMERLVYVNAFVKEVLRWRPLAALGAPHSVTEHDEYAGYSIPKGTTVIANQLAMELDEQVWDSPEQFEPERWLRAPTKSLVSFGFGRRKCTGQYMAMESLYIMISRMLWAFRIQPGTDENGLRVDIDPWGFTESGSVLVPDAFKADLDFRDAHRREVVASTWSRTEKDIDRHLDRIADGFVGS